MCRYEVEYTGQLSYRVMKIEGMCRTFISIHGFETEAHDVKEQLDRHQVSQPCCKACDRQLMFYEAIHDISPHTGLCRKCSLFAAAAGITLQECIWYIKQVKIDWPCISTLQHAITVRTARGE